MVWVSVRFLPAEAYLQATCLTICTRGARGQARRIRGVTQTVVGVGVLGWGVGVRGPGVGFGVGVSEGRVEGFGNGVSG